VNNVLVAVDSSKGSEACVAVCARLFAGRPQTTVTLVHVMQYGGPAAADDLTIDAELSELRETLEGSPQLEALTAKAEAMIATHRKFLEDHGLRDLRTVIKTGRPADEILRAAAENKAELIIIGNTRSLINKLLMGDVARKVAHAATVPVLLAR
jgi:nucleotide-binding universal stress UspA family protein